MSIYQKRNAFELHTYNTAISRADFEAHFTKTTKTVRFTFNGWDGKSYDGEARNAKVLHCDIEGLENVRFIKVGKSIHYIDEKSNIMEKATGECHPETIWFVDVERA